MMGTKNGKRALAVSIFCAALGAPSGASAAVQITEIMYDLPGTDAGREWVEVTNTGGSALDITGYKFFEANTNHALTLLSGVGVLSPQGSAIIAEDQTKFMADYPAFSGTLLKASFDLSNTGEDIALKSNSTASPDDSVVYDSSMGGSGDGTSLQRSGTGFIAAAPNPGTYAVPSSASSDSDASAEASSASALSAAEPAAGAAPAPLTVRTSVPEETMVGGGSFFSAVAYGSAGLPLEGARYIWNFGDGATAEGARVFHAYDYPGVYAVGLTAASNLSSAYAAARITAVPAAVELLAEGDGSLTVADRSTSDLDIGLWMLRESSSTFIIPERTTVLAGKGVRFSPLVTRVYGGESAQLLYPNGAEAASASPGAHSPLRGEPVELAVPSGTPAPAVIHAPRVPSVSATSAPALSAAAGASGAPLPLEEALLGLGALIVLGVAGVWYARSAPAAAGIKEETFPSAEEFEIE